MAPYLKPGLLQRHLAQEGLPQPPEKPPHQSGPPGERYSPRGLMGVATFGTNAFIRETVKAFEDGHVNLEQFGKDVLSESALGAGAFMTSGIPNMVGRISSAGALGFMASKMQGGDNREAGLHSVIWGLAEGLLGLGQSQALREEAVNNIKDTFSDYARSRNPDIPKETADNLASQYVENSIKNNTPFENSKDLAKNGPEHTLEWLEKVNQMVRNAQIPHPGTEPGEPLPKLPARSRQEAPT